MKTEGVGKKIKKKEKGEMKRKKRLKLLKNAFFRVKNSRRVGEKE